jgi:hypothetical protein
MISPHIQKVPFKYFKPSKNSLRESVRDLMLYSTAKTWDAKFVLLRR